jgi:hypothetical protein
MYTESFHLISFSLHIQGHCVRVFLKIVSITSTVIMVILFLSELSSYMEIKTGSEMFIDVNRGGEKVTIMLNLVKYKS